MSQQNVDERESQGVEDLNRVASGEFRRLVHDEVALLPLWRDAALSLSENEVPDDLSALEILLHQPSVQSTPSQKSEVAL